MRQHDSDIPAHLRGDRTVVVAELEGSPFVASASDEPDLIIKTDNGLVRLSDLPVLARIEGVSEEAADSIASTVCAWHEFTGTPLVKITRETLLQALVSQRN